MILSIDCGSTNHKVALYDESLKKLAACSRPVAYIFREPERTEFDAEEIWRNTLSLIHEACAISEKPPDHIEKIAIASQAQTFTILDKTGAPLMPFISWMDGRSQSESEELTLKLGEDFHKHCSFPFPVPQLQLSKLLWLARNKPQLLNHANTVVSMPGLLSLRIAGFNGLDANLAAMSGLYSLSINEWRPEALEIVGLKRRQLGSPVKIGGIIPVSGVCRDISFSPRIGVVFAGNDQTAGAYANLACSGQPVLTLGTALVIYRYAGEERGPYHRDSCWGPYPGGGYYELTTRAEGCAALDWAIDELTAGNREDFMRQAESARLGAARFYPRRMGAKSAWIGSDNSSDMAGAVLEGICFSMRQLMEDELKIRMEDKPLIITGGGSQSRFWLRMIAEVLNCPVRRGEGDALLGGAMMACPGVKPPAAQPESVIMPDFRRVEIYERIYRQWLKSNIQR